MDRPWMKLWTRRWLDSKQLRRCSPAARGVLADLMCLAHEGTPYGFLRDEHGPLEEAFMASRCVTPLSKFRASVSELKKFDRITEHEGALVVPQMVEDEEERLLKVKQGGSGGNPKLTKKYNTPGFVYFVMRSSDSAVKIGIAINVKSRIWKIKSSLRNEEVDLIGTLEVDDMGARESELHQKYAPLRLHGDWFRISREDVELELKGSETTSLIGSVTTSDKLARAPADSDSDSDSNFFPENKTSLPPKIPVVDSEISENTSPLQVLEELRTVYDRIGVPWSPREEQQIIQHLIGIEPASKRRRVIGYVDACVAVGRWSGPAKTMGLLTLLQTGKWDVDTSAMLRAHERQQQKSAKPDWSDALETPEQRDARLSAEDALRLANRQKSGSANA